MSTIKRLIGATLIVLVLTFVVAASVGVGEPELFGLGVLWLFLVTRIIMRARHQRSAGTTSLQQP